MTEAQKEALHAFETALERAKAEAKPTILKLAEAYNLAVDNGADAAKLRDLRNAMQVNPIIQVSMKLVDANDPEVAKAIRDLGLQLES